MNSRPLWAIAHASVPFSDRDPLGRAFEELNSGWPAVVMVKDDPHLLLPSDAVGHHESRRLFDLPLLPAFVLPGETPIRQAFHSIGDEDFIVVQAGDQFGVIRRKTILEALVLELDLPEPAEARGDASLADIIDELPEGIVVLDSEQRITFFNRPGKRLLAMVSTARLGDRVESLAEVPLQALLGEAAQGLPSYLQSGKPALRTFSLRILRSTCERPLTMVLIIRDVTHIRHRQIREATRERMALLGRLASGIAHDFNNMLTVIMAQASLIQLTSEAGVAMQARAEVILSAAQKSSHLVRQLLVFGRGGIAHTGAMNLSQALKELEAILQNLVGAWVELELRLPEDLWLVAIDPVQIERIVANLVVNSRNAMPRGGRILIEASNLEACTHLGAGKDGEPVRAVRIRVGDTGKGMTPETLTRVFEPFFTTHEEDGTGLGMATVQCEVAQLGGAVNIQSELGVGTTVEIFLPVSDQPPRTAPAVAPHPSGPGLGGHILVLEDQFEVRDALQGLLEHAGYEVRTAAASQEALERLSEGGQPDLLILDPSLKDPGSSSFEEACRRFPTLRVLMLDWATDASLARMPALGQLDYLPKPFSGVELLERVSLLIGDGMEDP